MKLFKTILFLMLIASAVPTGLLGYLAFKSNRDKLVTQAQELAEERVSRLRLQISNLLGETRRAAESAAADFPIRDDESARRSIAALLSARDEVRVATVFDLAGARRPGLQAFRGGDRTPEDLAEHDEAAHSALALDPVAASFSPPYLVSDGFPAVTLTVPLRDAVHGGRTGFLAVEISLARLQSLVAGSRFGARGIAFVVDQKGRVIAHPDGSRLQSSTSPTVREFLAYRSALAGGTARVREFSPEGVLGACANLGELPWGVIAEQPVDDAYLVVRRMLEQISLGLAIALAIAILLATGFSRMVTRPIRGFTEGAMKIARGVFGVEVDVKTKNELGELASTFNYMSKQLQAYDSETRGLYESLERGYLETLIALANAIDSKDPYTRGHSQRVGELAAEIGKEMGLTPRTVKNLLYGGILHDIGKIGIVEHILGKQTKLTNDEMAVMREHPSIGASIVEPVSVLSEVLPAVRNHHERWDGTGYPDGLKAEKIPMVARVVSCADVWDACTSDRPYSKAVPVDRALEIMRGLGNTSLDPKVVDALERVIQKKLARGERVTMAEDAVAAVAANT
jgi:putative nucleotidyltransferase with HDIG domain